MIDRDVELKLGEKTYVLSPTLDAMRKINRSLGSPVEALQRAKFLDFDAICTIISAGASLSQKQSERLQAEVFAAGLVTVTNSVAEFIGVLLDPTGSKDEGDDSGKS